MLAAIAGWTSACSLSVDLDELHGGDGGGSSFGGSSSGDGGGTDQTAPGTSSSSSSSSSGALPDGGLDCSGTTFCDDFERGEFKGSWDDFGFTKGSTISMIREGRTGSSAVRFSVSPQQDSVAMLFRQLPAARAVDLRYSFRVGAGPVKHTNFFSLSFEAGAKQRGIFLVLENTQATYVDQLYDGTVKDYHEAATFDLPFGRWIDVALTFDVPTRKLSVTFDGKSVVDGYVVNPLPSEVSKIYCGVPYTAAGTAFDIDVDAVRVTVTPK